MSPMQQTHKYLKDHGFTVAKTEHWNHYAKRRQDLFGFIDTLALNPNTWDALLAVQSTTGDHHADRRDKILAHEVTYLWLRHARLELWSWSKRGARGKRKLWTLRRERFVLGGGGTPGDETVLSFETETPLDEI